MGKFDHRLSHLNLYDVILPNFWTKGGTKVKHKKIYVPKIDRLLSHSNGKIGFTIILKKSHRELYKNIYNYDTQYANLWSNVLLKVYSPFKDLKGFGL